MQADKVKILFLGFSDTPFEGHVLSIYKKLPEELFDKKIVVLKKQYPADDVEGLYSTYSKVGKLKFKSYRFIQQLKTRLKCKINNNESQYCYFYTPHNKNTAERILSKISGFKPDVIFLGWSSLYLSPASIRQLYDNTKASFIFYFVDQQFISGGCHYHLECRKYLSDCSDCPALSGKQNLSEEVFRIKQNLWMPLNKYVIGNPCECRDAVNSVLFKNATIIPYIKFPEVIKYDAITAKDEFNVSSDNYCIMIGATSFNDKRKGMDIGMKGIIDFAGKVSQKIDLLIVGSISKEDLSHYALPDNINIICTGFLSKVNLFKAYCASDCFVSPTLADSGPIMVNFAFLLDTPIVSFNVGVANDLVIHGENGYIATERNYANLAMGLEYIYNNRITIKNNISSFNSQLKEKLLPYNKWYTVLYEKEMERLCTK